MKKTIRKILAVCLIVFAAAGMLCACGSKKKDISGTYHAAYNMKDELNKKLAADGMEMESDLITDFVLLLNSDESFSLDIDGEGFNTALIDVLTKDGPAMISRMMEAEGVTEDMRDTVAAASGYESYEAFVEDMMQTIVAEMGDGFTKELESQIHFEGKYSLDGSTLTLSGTIDGQEGTHQGTLNEDGTISLTSKIGDASLDLTFKKQ